MGTRLGFGGGLGDEACCFEGFVGVEFVGFLSMSSTWAGEKWGAKGWVLSAMA